MGIAQQILDNYPQTWEEYVQRHGPLFEKSTGRSMSEMFNDQNRRERFEKELSRRKKQSFAAELTEGKGVQNAIAGFGNELAGIASLAGMLDGPGGLTMQNIYNNLKTPYQLRDDLASEELDTESEDFIQDFIQKNSISVSLGVGAAFVPEVVFGSKGAGAVASNRFRTLLKKRGSGATLTADENIELIRMMLKYDDATKSSSIPLKQIDRTKNKNIAFMSKTDDFTSAPNIKTTSDTIPGIRLIENLKTRTDKLGRPFTSEYQEKLKLLKELNKNKYIDPRTNKPFTPEDWLKPKKPDGKEYSPASFASIRSKIRQGPGFLDKKAAYQKTYMAKRKANEPGFQDTFNKRKKQEYYTSARKQKKSSIPTPGKSVLVEERNRLLGYMTESARKQKSFKGELSDYDDVYKNNKFVGVKDNKSGITYLEAGYRGRLKPNEKLISDHPEATNIIDLVDTAKKFKYGKLNTVLSDYFSDFNRLPTPAELFNFLSADRNFLGYMSKKRMTQNPLEIHHMLGTRYDPTKNVQLTLRDRNDAAGKVFRNFVEGRVDEKTAIKQIKNLNVRVKLPGGEEFIGGKQLTALKSLAEARKRLTRMINKEIKDNPNFKEEFRKYFNEVIYKRQEFAKGGYAMKINDALQKEVDNNNQAYEEANRQFFEEGDFVEIPEQLTGKSFGFGGIQEVQQDIKDLYKDELEDMKKYAEQINRPIELKAGDILKETRKVMNKGERPLELRPLEEGYKLITQNPIVRRTLAAPWTLEIAALESIEAINNKLRGEDGQIDFEKRYPKLYEFEQELRSGVKKTNDLQKYTSVIDEINRAQDRALVNTSFNIVDLLALIPDLSLGTEYGNEIKRIFSKYDQEELVAKPETFLGEVGAIGLEFGIPANRVNKIVNSIRRGLTSKFKRVNLFAQTTYNLKGLEKYKTHISNVFKRVGTAAAVGGGAGIIAGGYNTISQQYKEDPLLLDEALGYDYEDTSDLTGRDLTLANFRNRLRFGAEDSMIAGMFPLLGPVLWQTTKYGAIKPGVAIGSAALKTLDTVAIKPVTYLASKDPVVLPGIARGTKIFADFLGKDVITRATVTAMGARPGLIKELPDYKDWRMFELTSEDPLQRSLKKFDNVLSFFRDVGRNSANSFYLTTKTERAIKGKSREVEKYIESIETKAYDLANGFAGRYKTGLTSPAGEKYILEQVLEVLKGKLDVDKLPEELVPMVKGLDDLIVEIKTKYKDILPEDDALRIALTKNIKEYMRQSFQVFKNPQYKPNKKVYNDAVRFMENRIRANESLVIEALKKGGIQKYARDSVDDILHTTRTEGRDPIDQLNRISKNILKMDDTLVKTGEELPDVIKKLLGEETGSLREAVLTTTTDLLTISSRTKMYDQLADLLVAEGRLFESADAARAARVFDAVSVGRVAGLGNYGSKIENLYGSKEVTDALRSSGGVLDKLLENEYVGGVMQGLVGYKAMVQSGKTVLSPATQTRNFGSASLFPLLNGWIGGNASVRDAFKIVMDDIFGAGRTVDEEALIKNIGRKIELGVLDENIVASELQAVLKDIKSGKITKFGDLAGKLENNPIMKQATRVYAGGDNIWKWYSHEYVMSMLKHAFKTTDEVKKAYKDSFGVTKTFEPKDMTEALEEYAAAWVRDAVPTYSKVPPSIQAIRKIPFIGNFVSFPAEIFRTVLASSSLAMRNIASDNAVLREAGFRTMIGSAITLGAVNETMKGLGYLSTNVNEEMMSDIKKYFAADFQKYSELMPISNYENGAVKVFDLSRYNPYDVVIAPVKNLITRATNPQEKLDPEKIDQDVFKEFVNASGPLFDLLKDTFFGISIGYEPVGVAFSDGKTKTGKSVFSDSDSAIEKFDKFIMNAANTIEPGALSSLQRMYGAIAGDVTATGLPRKIRDELAKLFGAAPVEIDVKGSFAFDIGDFQSSLTDPRTSEGYYSTKNWRQRGPDQLVREYNQMNEEGFRAQYEFYKVVRAALKHNLMTRKEIKDMMKDRKISEKNISRILSGRFIPLATGEGGLEGRYDKILRSNPEAVRELGKYYFVPKGTLNARKRFWSFQRFEDYEKQLEEAKEIEPGQQSSLPAEPVEQEPQTPQLPDTAAAQPGPPPVASVPNPATGLTPVESSLLSREEQRIRQRQRGLA